MGPPAREARRSHLALQAHAPQAAAPGAPPEHAALSLSLPPRLSIPHGEAPWQGLCGIKESDTA